MYDTPHIDTIKPKFLNLPKKALEFVVSPEQINAL
jgi:hypothetical protein